MLRRDLLRASLVLGSGSALAQQRPNVLFVAVDDLDCRIAPYGDPVAITPNLDRLARRGVRFDRAYCQYPLCNPTRSSVLTGRYPTSTRVLDNNTLLVLEGDQATMPDYFAGHGYSVGQFGKIFHGPNRGMKAGGRRPAVGAQTWYTPDERGRQQAENPAYWNTDHSPYRNMMLEDPGRYAWANAFGPLAEGDLGADHKIASDALGWLSRHDAAKPFFLAVGFHKPHVPLTAPRRYFDQYDPARIPLPPDFDSEPRPIKGYPPLEFRQNIDLFAGRAFTALEARQAMHAYYACVSYMDAQLGRLLDRLDEAGIADNTVVVLWGDHGWHLSEKGIWAKGTLFEVSARGPLIIADPRRRAGGQVSRRVVQYLDMYPTLLDLCGLPRAGWLEGASLTPLLDNPAAAWDRPAFTVQARNWQMGRSVRTERWRYTEWDEGRRGAALFDHDNDPHEMTNLAADTAHGATVQKLRKLFAQIG